ncbi:hypothetical protein V1264_016888 [Littorina saxatilis]|uniref:DDE-1 domain-containing protein n=1 Tax=Littorina saxatilis TaxID=31220 RepID=A0AAN9BHH0_9CAEN
MDECALFFRMLPDRTFEFKSKKCHGGKQSKERVTVSLCCNMDGSEKQSLLVIGKFAKPRCFKGIELPLRYTSNKKAWMTSDLFEKWLRDFDRSMDSANRKVLLVIDNCTAHVKIQGLLATEVLFLPPNATSKLQPLDCGVIKNLKFFYRSRLLSRLILHVDSGLPLDEFSVTLLDAVRNLKRAWDNVKPSTVRNCFRKAGFNRSDLDEGEACTEMPCDVRADIEAADMEPLLSRLYKELGVSLEEFCDVDNDVATCAVPSTEDILSSLSSTRGDTDETINDNNDNNDSDGDDCGEQPPSISKLEALSALSTIELYLLQTRANEEIRRGFQKFSGQLEHLLLTSSTIQSRITDFFSSPSKPEQAGHSFTWSHSTSPPSTSKDTPRPSTSKDTPRPSTCKDTPRPSTSKDTPRPSTSKDTPRPSTSKDTPRPSTSKDTPRPSTSKDTPRPSTSKDTPRPSTSKDTPRPSTNKDTPRPSTSKGSTRHTTDDSFAFFDNLATLIKDASSYEELENIVAAETHSLFAQTPITYKPYLPEKPKVDNVSLELYPDDAPQRLPVRVCANGNCLPRCGSLLAYGDEDHHTEMRVRIIFEMVHNSHDVLASGTDLQNLVKTYMSYSGQVFSINVTEEDMKNLFQNEVMNCRCPGSYMSMWGIHGLSSVLGVPVQSVYPQYGGFNVRKDLHRVVQPRICRQSEINTSQESLPTIMWTSCLGKDKPASTWVPNHFVVCVPYS